MKKDIVSFEKETVTEMCPHCDTEVTVRWDIGDGMQTVCPTCGEKMMLCSMCEECRDNAIFCDWDSNKKACRHSK